MCVLYTSPSFWAHVLNDFKDIRKEVKDYKAFLLTTGVNISKVHLQPKADIALQMWPGEVKREQILKQMCLQPTANTALLLFYGEYKQKINETDKNFILIPRVTHILNMSP